jgi:putative redox protein
MPKVSVEWKGKFKFAATNESGHTLMMDAPVAAGGENTAPSPLQLILMSVAGCSGVDIVAILDKMKVKVDTFNMDVEGTRAESHPKVFTGIKVVYKFTGTDIDPDKVSRAIKLSVDKYCSAIHMVNKTAQINFVYEINGIEYQLQ